MLLADKKEFSRELKSLMAVYNRPADPDIFSVWWNILEEYPIRDVKNAFSLYAEKEKFPPVPSEVLKYVKSRERKVLADEAWEHVPKSESESGYVTARMMQALGVAEESLAMNDHVGAKLAFIRTYDNLPDDNVFKYSQAYGVAYEDKEQRQIDDYKILESKGWMKKESLLTLKPHALLMIENGSSETLTESEKKQGKDTVSTIKEMLNLNQKDTSPH